MLEFVRIAPGSGRDRKVWLTLDADETEKVYVGVRSRATSKCLLTGETAPKGSRLAIVVEEDVPGPINPRGKAQLRL